MINFKPGLIESPDDARDFVLTGGATAPFPVKAKYIPPFVYDQGNTGMCAPNAFAFGMCAMQMKLRKKPVRISRGHVYANRQTKHWPGEGMVWRELLSTQCITGAVLEDMFPEVGTLAYLQTLLSERTLALIGYGEPHRLDKYFRLRNITDLCNYLAMFETPAFFGSKFTESFFQTGANGIIPKPAGAPIGGHAMAITEVFQMDGLKVNGFNSYSERWGRGGQFTIDLSEHPVEMWGGVAVDPNIEQARPKNVMMTIGSDTMVVDNKIVKLPQAPFITPAGKTVIAVREMAESVGYTCKFYWMADGRHVIHLQDGGEMELGDQVAGG